MKPILVDFSDSSAESLYIQLYRSIRDDILSGQIREGEKLPSLRNLSRTLNISITTTQQAYNQLLVEGYIVSRPQSGYYVAQVLGTGKGASPLSESDEFYGEVLPSEENPYICDSSCFDFNKWKKCSSKVFNDYSDLLLFESDPQGEAALRAEICKYVFSSRGVKCSPSQVVIGAGTQQITGHLCRILLEMNIHHVSLESPGYLPVHSMFSDGGFTISHIPVTSEGIEISKLPINIPSAVYVSPSNQFPTGAVMPVGKRNKLLDWAADNDSIIIEDDYDSELRYFGKPVPALQSLDKSSRVVYLGSFSSTLFPAVKISYMVLPEPMAAIFSKIKYRYTQTCSKAEQLTLALFMEQGYYNTGIRKLRSLYSQKLALTMQALASVPGPKITPTNTQSGINLIIRVRTKKTADELCHEAKSIGLQVVPMSDITDQDPAALIFYYSKLPIGQIDTLIRKLAELWSSN